MSNGVRFELPRAGLLIAVSIQGYLRPGGLWAADTALWINSLAGIMASYFQGLVICGRSSISTVCWIVL